MGPWCFRCQSLRGGRSHTRMLFMETPSFAPSRKTTLQVPSSPPSTIVPPNHCPKLAEHLAKTCGRAARCSWKSPSLAARGPLQNLRQGRRRRRSIISLFAARTAALRVVGPLQIPPGRRRDHFLDRRALFPLDGGRRLHLVVEFAVLQVEQAHRCRVGAQLPARALLCQVMPVKYRKRCVQRSKLRGGGSN